MAGIERIQIDSDWCRSNDWRLNMSKDLALSADNLYRRIFQGFNMDILPDIDIIACTKQEAIARYDWKEGIDVILHFKNGTKATLQEKFLDYPYSTCTFEEKKHSGVPGAWYYCTAQYYFVGYARNYKQHHELSFQDWILIDLPLLHRLDAVKKLNWHMNRNKRDGRGATFRYIYFKDLLQESCVLASMESLIKEKQIEFSNIMTMRSYLI